LRPQPASGFVLASAFCVFSGAACGEEYPNKSIRFIVPYPPGGATTTTARVIAQRMQEEWGQQIIIDNRGGAATVLGTEAAARAPGDGYTLLLGNFGWAVTPALHDKLNYDVVRDFSPVSLIANGSLALLVHPSSPIKSVKDLISLAKASPGKLNFGSSGGGSSSSLGALLFRQMTGVQITGVDYKGGGPMLVGLLSVEIQFGFVAVAAAMPQIKNNQLRVIGVSTLARSRVLPDVPTISEAGVKGYELNSWYGVVVPAKTSPAIVNKINALMVRAIAAPDVQQILISAGLEPASSTPAEFFKYVAREVAKWNKLIKNTGIRDTSG
jgi:tripartite-type tricarboxylate transporter receptor subunit TctC